MRLTTTDTTWLAEENRGIGWSPTMKGSYTQSGGNVISTMEYADLDIDTIAEDWKDYDTLTEEQKIDQGIPLNKHIPMTISGNSISWGDLTVTRDIYADKLANTILGGTVDGKMTENGDARQARSNTHLNAILSHFTTVCQALFALFCIFFYN